MRMLKINEPVPADALRYDVPEGFDPSAVIMSLHRHDIESGPLIDHGHVYVVIPRQRGLTSDANWRTEVRHAIEATDATPVVGGLPPVRFTDER